MRIATATIAVIAVMAAFMGVMYLRFSGDSVPAPNGGNGDSDILVVVARHDIVVAGTVISAEMLTVVEKPKAQVILGAYTDSERIVGKVAKIRLGSGEQFIAAKVAPWQPTPVSIIVPAGKHSVGGGPY